MHPLQFLITTTDYMGHNFAHNLGFLSDEQLTFKPSPTANSALEITHQAATHLLNMKAILTEGKVSESRIEVPTSGAEAQELITRAISEFAEWLKTLDGNDFGEPVQLDFGSTSRGQCIMMPVLDLVHHHGQIVYIQTILGDTESHLYALEMEGAAG